jgi:hypothetical protein
MGFGGKRKDLATVTTYPKGVFVNPFTIVSVEDNPSTKFKQDISLLVLGTTEGAEWEKKLFLGGNHVWEQDKPVDFGTTKKGVQGGSWRISHFLKSAGLDDKTSLTEDGSSLKDDVKADLIGRTFYILEYESTGDRARTIWKFFASESEGKRKLLNDWNNQEEKWVPEDYAHKGNYDVNNKQKEKFDAIDDEAPF